MKRCPQCNTVFEDEKDFCTADGTRLINETFSLPSDFAPKDHPDDEQQTVIRYKPIKFDIPKPKTSPQPKAQTSVPNKPNVNPYAPHPGGTIPSQTVAKPKGGCFKSFLILLLGLFIGGGIVLAILGVGYVYINNFPDQNTTGEKTADDRSDNKTDKQPNDNTDKKPTGRHSEQNTEIDESRLNGRVIRTRASLRTSPANRSKRVARLPKNDRLEVIRRKSSKSKWYEVRCEHGVRGWIDGNQIELTN
jgi:hypothetical protein